jgi:hypothetical protein
MYLRCKDVRVRQKFGGFFDEVSSILYQVDPMGINYEINPDEYEPEASTILPRLREWNSLMDVQQIIHQEFIRWFNKESAGSESHYQQAAERIWNAWQLYLESKDKP